MSEVLKAAVENSPTLISAVRELSATTLGAICLLGIAVAVAIYKCTQHPLFVSFLGRRDARAKHFEAYLMSSASDKSCKAVVADVRDAMIFQDATGIYAEAKWRKGLVKLREAKSASWLDMKLAKKYMELKANDTIVIRDFTKGDRAGYWWNVAMMVIFVIWALIVFIAALVSKPSLENVLLAIALSIALVVCAAGIIMQNQPLSAAKRLK